MSFKIKPLRDRVLIQQLEETPEKVGNLYVPDTAKEKPQIGKVIAVGTDEDLQKTVKAGDKIIYAKYGGTEIKYDGENYIILSADDILAILG
ncbi:MAG: co-chaperone GroES [bacterium]|nr:co-chaperone GroES [bacterium]